MTTPKILYRQADDNLSNMPEILYKYRDYNDDYHKRLLFNRELYFTSADRFNDPFDAALPFRYDPVQLTPENIFLKYTEMIRKDHPDWNDTQIHNEAFLAQQSDLMNDDVTQERFQVKMREDLNKTFGIVSLSEVPNDILMWSHYANCHTGFCLGINPKHIFKNFSFLSLNQIVYSEEFPFLDLFGDPMQFFVHVLCTKSKCWSYEKEYRLVSRKLVNASLDITEWGIKEIYLGAKMPFKEKERLVRELKEIYSKVKIFDCSLSETAFKVETMQIY